MSLRVIPITLELANLGVARWHRHHRPVLGAKWALGCVDASGLLHGVAIAGRPVARMLDDGVSVEVTRVATDGTANACSCLYGAMRRVAREMGYARVLTYILDSETGASLRGAGWTPTVASPGGRWSCPSRPREDTHPLGPKQRWECRLRAAPPVLAGFGPHPVAGTLFEDVS
jgi:hypothetical protein